MANNIASGATLEQTAAWQRNFALWCHDNLQIPNRSSLTSSGGKLISFDFNKAQRQYVDRCDKMMKQHGRIGIWLTKAHGLGVTTMLIARGLWRALLWPDETIFAMGHDKSEARELVKMTRDMYKNISNQSKLRLINNNMSELRFSNGSCYIFAGAKDATPVGSGLSITYAYLFETEKWKHGERRCAEITGSVSYRPGSEIHVESTPYGKKNFHYRMYENYNAFPETRMKIEFLP